MKRFDEIKNQPHDASGLDNPNEWLWQRLSENVPIWYPAKKIDKEEDEKFSDDSFIQEIEDAYYSGGNIYLDFITLKDGTLIVIGDDAISLHLSRDAFDEGQEPIYYTDRPTLYRVFSPDGLEFHPTHAFTSEDKAWEAFENDYKKRFEPQGYYSIANRTRIPIDELKNYCSVKPI